ncbi:MAG: response regulator transcription factor [Bacteroidales bacterium]|nr:response regulator transcription factor [Bacteroidales bacterium]
MLIKCVIADDEQYARKLLADYVTRVPGLELAGQCKNAMDVIKTLHNQPVDLLFLDIQMPDMTGVELLKTLSSKPVVIFTTAYKEYAIEGYELDVIDYMLKPISFERFMQGVNKAVDFIRMKKNQKDPHILSIPSEPVSETINLKADYKIYRVKLDDILYIEGLKEYVSVFTIIKRYIVLESLKRLEEILPAGRFMRVHKSYIVNIKKINALYGNTIEMGDKEIPIGKLYAEEVKKKLFSL